MGGYVDCDVPKAISINMNGANPVAAAQRAPESLPESGDGTVADRLAAVQQKAAERKRVEAAWSAGFDNLADYDAWKALEELRAAIKRERSESAR